MVYNGQNPTKEVRVNIAATPITTHPSVPLITSVANRIINTIDNITRMILSVEPMLVFIIC